MYVVAGNRSPLAFNLIGLFYLEERRRSECESYFCGEFVCLFCFSGDWGLFLCGNWRCTNIRIMGGLHLTNTAFFLTAMSMSMLLSTLTAVAGPNYVQTELN